VVGVFRQLFSPLPEGAEEFFADAKKVLEGQDIESHASWSALPSARGNYDRKVFNNIWGTFTFGPDNTVYLGAYRGFLRFWSDDDMP